MIMQVRTHPPLVYRAWYMFEPEVDHLVQESEIGKEEDNL